MAERRLVSRRDFIRMTAAAGSVLAVAACSPAPTATPAAPAQPAAPAAQPTAAPAAQPAASAPKGAKLTVIQLETAPARLAAWEEVRKRFAAKFPGTTYDVISIPWAQMMEKAATAVGGGSDLDVSMWWDDQRVPQLAANGFLLPLDEYIKRDNHKLDDYYQQALDSNKWKGQQWGLPYYWDVRPFYWNKKHFSEAGLDPNKPPTNWDEWRQVSEKLSKPWPIKDTVDRLGGIPLMTQGTGYSLTGNSWLWIYGWMNGGEFTSADLTKVTTNAPEIVEALEWTVNWVKDFGGADRLAAFGQKAAAGGLHPFTNESLSTMITCSACITVPVKQQKPDLLKDIGVAIPPTKKVKVTWSGVLANNLFKTAKARDLGWEFIKFNNLPETMIYYGETNGFLPTRKSVVDNPVFSADEEIRLATKEMLPITRIRPPIPASQVIWDELVRAVDKAMTGQATPKQALDDCTTKVQAELDKYLK